MSMTRTDYVALLRSAGIAQSEAARVVDIMFEHVQQLAASPASGPVSGSVSDSVPGLVPGFEQIAALGTALDPAHEAPDGAARAARDAAHRAMALRHRQEVIAVLRRRELEQAIATAKQTGLSFLEALAAIMVGDTGRLFGTRQSVDARRACLFHGWLGQFEQALAEGAERHGLSKQEMLAILADDRTVYAAFVQERLQPGSAKNAKVSEIADLYDRLAATMRLRLSQAGADMAEQAAQLPLLHDVVKMLDPDIGTKQDWIERIAEVVDAERSFPGADDNAIHAMLSARYDAIVSSRDRLAACGIAAGSGRDRELHFSDAQSCLAYMYTYGRFNLWEAIVDAIDRNARALALIETFGPNPEQTIRALLDHEKAAVRLAVEQGALDAETGRQQTDALDAAFVRTPAPTGPIADWLAVLAGVTQNPACVGAAKAFGMARSVQRMSTFGEGMLPAVAEVFERAASLRADGVNFLERHLAPFEDVAEGDIAEEDIAAQRRIWGDMGLLLEWENSALIHRFDQADSVPGFASGLVNMFFTYSGDTFWADKHRAGMAQWLSHLLGRSRDLAFDALHPDVRAMLMYHGFDKSSWNVVRAHMMETYQGKVYCNPSLAKNIPEAALAGLLAEYARGDAPPQGMSFEQWTEARDLEGERLRADLEKYTRSFFVDETKFEVLEPEADADVLPEVGPGTDPEAAPEVGFEDGLEAGFGAGSEAGPEAVAAMIQEAGAGAAPAAATESAPAANTRTDARTGSETRPGEAVRSAMRRGGFPAALYAQGTGGGRRIGGSLHYGLRYGAGSGLDSGPDSMDDTSAKKTTGVVDCVLSTLAHGYVAIVLKDLAAKRP